MPTTPTPGRPAPALDVPLIIGLRWDLADQSPGLMTMITVYRGLHCPICRAHLGRLRGLYERFLDHGVECLNVSMDGEDGARRAHEEWGLDPIPMGYGLSREQAEGWGLWLSEGRTEAEPPLFAEPALFLVRPDGTLWAADVASTPFLRPDLDGLLGKLDLIREKDYPPRGTAAA